MGWTGVILALTLPWLAASLWLRRLWQQPLPGLWPLVLGYGYLFGLMGVALFLALMGALGGRLGAGLPLGVAALLVLLALWQLRANGLAGSWLALKLAKTKTAAEAASLGPGAEQAADPEARRPWQTAAFALLLTWLLLRLLDLTLEVWWLPLFPWDAWTTWGFRAKAWVELGELVPFVSPQTWLAQPETMLFNLPAWTYPKTLSLIAAWPALALGAWDETAANLPWLGAALALGLGIYGQARLWSASPLTALVLVWLILSLPLLDTQVALAGYGELWVSLALGLGFMAFLHWARSRDPRQGLLALFALVSCAALKNEGLVWAALFIPALAAAWLRWTWLLAMVLAGLGLAALVWLSGGLTLDLPGLGTLRIGPDQVVIPGLGEFHFAYHDPWEPVLRHTFLYSNWHLFPFLLPLALVAALGGLWRQPEPGWRAAGLVWALSILTALYILFFWTEAYLWAVQASSFNRMVLHFTPALLFWMMALWLDEYRNHCKVT